MTRTKRRATRASALTAVLLLAAAICAACGTKAKLVGQGGECELATDCEADFVCILQKDGRRICDSDLSQVQPPPEVADAGARDARPRDGSGDAPPATDAPITPVQDTSVPPVDAAGTPDTSPPAQDAASE